MISRATIDAATRVTAFAAWRPIALDLSVMPTPRAETTGAALDQAGAAPAAVAAGTSALQPHAQEAHRAQRNAPMRTR